jgi:hypothetical protein
VLAPGVGIAYASCMQYTVRGIPPAIDAAIRERAKAESKSLNEVAVEALADGLGLGDEDVARRDLSDVVGTWKKDAAVEAVLAAQDRVDEDLWK